MAEKETAFSFKIAVSAVLTHKDGTIEDIDDNQSLQKLFKDYHLVEKLLSDEPYFHLQGTSESDDELFLKCYVFSDTELSQLVEAIESKHLASELTKYVLSCGLEAELGFSHKSDKQLSLLLELKGKTIRQGRSYFVKTASTNKIDGKTSLSQKKGGKKDADKSHLSVPSQSACVESDQQQGSNSGYAGGKKNDFSLSKSIPDTKPVSNTVPKSGSASKDTGDASSRNEDNPASVSAGRNDPGSTASIASSKSEDVKVTVAAQYGTDRSDTDGQNPTSGTDHSVSDESGTAANIMKSGDTKNPKGETTGEVSDDKVKRKARSLSTSDSDGHHPASEVKKIKVENENITTGSQGHRSSSVDVREPELAEGKTPPSISGGTSAATKDIHPELEILEKEVLIYIPPAVMKKKDIKVIYADFRLSNKDTITVEMRAVSEKMWTSNVLHFPLDSDPMQARISICYWKSWYSQTVTRFECPWIGIGDAHTHRQTFGQYFTAESYTEHVFHIMHHCVEYGLKDAIMQVDKLTRDYLREKQDHSDTILRLLKVYIEKEGRYLTQHTFSILGYVYGLLVPKWSIQKLSVWVTSSICVQILDDLKTITEHDLPSLTVPVFERIGESLVQTAYPQRRNNVLFILMEYCFPILSMEYFSRLIDKYVPQGNFSVLDDDYEYVISVLHSAYCHVNPNNVSSISAYLFKLSNNLPLKYILAEEKHLSQFKTDITVQDIILRKVSKQCRAAEKKKDIGAIQELYDLLSGWAKTEGDIASVLEQSIVCVLESAQTFNPICQEKVKILLLSDGLFLDPVGCEKVLKTLAASHHKKLHALFTEMLQQNFFKGDDITLTRITLKWFEEAIRLHCGDTRYVREIDDLPHVYHYLGSALSADCVMENKNLVMKLKQAAFRFLNKVDVQSLVDKVLVCDIVPEGSACQAVLNEHLQKYFFEGKVTDMMGVIVSRAGNSSWNPFSSRRYTSLYADMIIKCIELYGLDETENSEECFLLMMKNAEFWINVIKISAKHDFLKANVVFIKSKRACTEVATKLCRKTSSLLFSRNLCATAKSIEGKCTNLLLAASSEYKRGQIDEALSDLSGVMESVNGDKEFLASILHRLKAHYGSECLDLEKADQLFHAMKALINDGSRVIISPLLDKTFWGPFCNVLKSCKHISDVTKSESFWQVNKTVIHQLLLQHDISETVMSSSPEDDICTLFGEDRCEDDKPLLTVKVIEVLATEGFEKYENIWKPVFNGHDQNLRDMAPLLDVEDPETDQSIAEAHFNRYLPEWVAKAFHLYGNYFAYSKKLAVIRKVFKILHLDEMEKRFAESVQTFTALEEENVSDLTLRQLYETGKILEHIDQIVHEQLSCILEELSKSSHLVNFLQQIASEDLRNLIDAVEEHSEQSVQESTVSALIDVKRFLSPILRENPHSEVEQILRMLQKSLSDSKITNLDQKISECNTHLHSLKALFHNVANRGEVTKEIVKKAVQQGSKYVFTLSQSGCDVNLKYKSRNTTRTHTHSDICDLRSRVMLMNTDTKDQSMTKKSEKLKEEFEIFKQSVDVAMNIATILTELCQSGHPEYHDKYTASLSIPELKLCTVDYTAKLFNWRTALTESRSQYYWLNFFYPEQLRRIEHFFKAEGSEGERQICSLLSFTGYEFQSLSQQKDIYSQVVKDVGSDVFALKSVGKTLDKLFEGETPINTPLPDTKSGRVADAVQEGKLFVVGLNENSDFVVSTLLALYRNTTGCLPKASQVLFCQEDTLWEDIELLLRRCLGANKEMKPLFSIVCVENLSSELQFKLVDVLETMEEKSYLLAIICRGSAHHPILDHFGENVHQVQPMSQSAMEECLQTLWPNVITVTSDVPGQGKSEFIQELAWSRHMRVCSLHVSGEMNSKELVKKMTLLDMKPTDLLHIDIGMLSNPRDVDLLLSQLIVLGFVFHGSDLVKLTTKTICIEVANTISNTLRNSLNTAMCFKREMLTWKHYENFHASKETCSSVQVVCHYLRSYDCGKLDTTDLYFTGKDACKPLPEETCKALLKKYFASGTDMSFSIVRTFLNVLSDQLKKFSCSYFFRTTNISGMLGGDAHLKDVKSQLFRALLDVSREFATRSVHACREDQTASVQTMSQSADINQSMENLVSTSASAASMTKRVEAMIQWEESNHLLIAFHNQDIQTLSALYRKKTLVPKQVKTLFETQVKAALPEFSNLSHTELQDMLQRIARFKPGATSDEVMKKVTASYALTPDNLLKMILIILRTRAHVPVIIMGETGCGKTSLIRYLSVICGVDFEIQNIHAGIVEDEIIKRVLEVNEKALNSLDDTVWLFMDEINTCNHLGLINTILCSHRCQGKMLAPNLVVMAACNPYKIRSDQSIFTAGLETKVQADEKSRLVYRVNPLPESIVDFVWDYGSLSDSDETAYIKRMIAGCVQPNLENCVVALLVMSQKYIREREQSGSCVSLRDVSRCRKLIDWFIMTLEKKNELTARVFVSSIALETSAVVLALAHSYHSRLPDTSSRKTYRQQVAQTFDAHFVKETEESIFKIIQDEQFDILDRMEVPHGTAKNTALQENVFVILVCILNHIPVFVVGKPGCSKSLSLQLIKSNLRGKDSKDPYFQSLPQLFCVSYQGSESSTSDGILKVFAKAERYKENDKDNSVLPVVILDEIGLAEMSRFNPLKVLHSLLEPGDAELPNVAVVGISNWALDAAKMNRAIHLSRPDMDVHELFLTGISISKASVSDAQKKMRLSSLNPLKHSERKIDENLVKAIANAYLQYTGEQTFKNFHGLRDFYSLVKYVSREFSSLSAQDSLDPGKHLQIVMKGLLRNFGGLSSEIHSVLIVYRKHLKEMLSDHLPEMETIPSVLDLVADNIKDKSARHLLLATRGESALSIIEHLLDEMDRDYVSILGSRFEEDLTDDYNYRVLSRIILCMEQGMVLILKDLENIYGSLYDMLNQNYIIVGSKKNCRVALGAYSNPLCQVHDDFRCIVLVEEEKLDLSDPPFLNRFEKQHMKLTELLSPTELKAVSILEDWMNDIADIHEHTFTRSDVIPIDSPDMVASLVHFVDTKQNHESDFFALLECCKQMVLTMCSPESVVRLELSEFQKKKAHEVRVLQDYFFSLPVHKGLAHFLSTRLEESEIHLKEMIFTHSNLHSNVSACMEISALQCQTEKLGAFKSEKQLCTRIGSFWSDSSKTWLVFQCSPNADQENILLMKSMVDKEHNNYVSKKSNKIQKHVMIVIHMDRNESENTLSLVNFLSGWNMTFIDSLEKRELSLPDLLHKTKMQLIHGRRPITPFLKQHLFWAFTLLDYHDIPRSLASLKDVVDAIVGDSQLMMFLEEVVSCNLQEQLDADESHCWQLDVACDRLKLYNFLTLLDSLENEISTCIKHPLAALVYRLEASSSWDAVTLWCNSYEKERKREVWLNYVRDRNMVDTKSVPPPEGPECYIIMDSVLSLKCPFSKVFIEQVETLKEPFIEALRAEYVDFDVDEITEEIKDTMTSRFLSPVSQAAGDMFENIYSDDQFADYFHDFCNAIFSGIKLEMTEKQRTRVTEWSVLSRFTRKRVSFESDVCSLHITCWLYGSIIESELKLIDACLDLTETKLEDILQSQNLTTVASPSDLQNYSNESLKDVSSVMSEEEDLSEHVEAGTNEEKEHVSDHNAVLDVVDVGDIELKEHHTESVVGDEITLQSDDKFQRTSAAECKLPSGDELPYEDEVPITDDQPPCEDANTTLVSFACQQLIPTELLLSKLVLEKWINGVNLVLSLAGEVSLESKIFLSLRMCSDFTYIVLLPFKLPITYLHRFGQALKNDTLESETVFKLVCEFVDDLLNKGLVSCSVLQHFFSVYISSCLAADTENSLLQWTLSSLQNLSIFKETLNYFGPTLFQTMLIEIGEADIQGEENVVEESPVLKCLEECVFQDNGEPDSQLACLLLDILQVNFCRQSFTLDSDTLEEILKCDKIFKSDGLSLHHLFALAYLKNVLLHLASELNRKEAMDRHVIQRIHGIFSCDESDCDSLKTLRTKALQNYLLKIITQNSGLKRLEEVVNEYSSEWPFVSEFQMKDEHRFLALELCPMEMTCQDVFTRVLRAYDVLHKDRTQLKEILQSTKSNPEIMYGVFAVAFQQMYVVQSVRRLTDTERSDKVKEFMEECQVKLPDNQKQMFTNLCTFGDFAVQLLQTNPNKSSEDHLLSMSILHLICSVLAYNHNYGVLSHNSPFWLRCIQAPKDVQKLFLPGCGYKEGELCCCTLAPVVTKKTKYARSSCSCNSVTIHDVAIEDHQCNICQQPLQDSALCRISTMDSTGYDAKGYIFVDIGCLKSEFVSVRSLSPAAFRVLQFFVHGCLCASLALKFTTKEVLSKEMQLPEYVDASSYIESHLHVHWCALKHLTAMGDSQLAKLLNFIIKDCMPLIARHSVQFHSREERELYEEEFTTCIDKIMEKRFQIVQDETRLYHTRHSDSTASKHEMLLAEIHGDGDRLAEIPKLMRENILPSVENLQREFTIRKQVHDFPMMALLFDRMKDISLLQHLIPIVQWHKCVIRYGSHRLKRISCRTQTVQDFIHASQHQQLLNADNKKAELQKRFDNFMKSWNTLKGHRDDLKTYNQQLPELERIHQTASLQDCLMMTKQSPMMQVLLALQAIQNNFLSDAAVLCLSTNSLSLSFLKRSAGVVVVPEVQLEQINSKQIIPVPDLDDTLKFSQINTKLGHGRERHYDIYQIETQVVNECLLSKPMIKVRSSFPMINFAGESLHKTDELFENVSKTVGHEPVDKDLQNSILQLKEKSPSNMQILLDYLQMTFSLLNRTPVSGSDKNQYLSEFLQTWQSLFPNRVKEVDGLCSRVRLSQIISVYEFTEEVVADVIFHGLEEKYNCEVPGECMKQLRALLSNSGLKFQEALISALKKIVFRYVQSGFVSQDDKLAPLLMEKTLWPQGVYEDVVAKSRNPDAGLLHDEHCIEHIYCTIVFIAESVEKKKVKEEKKSVLFQPVAKKTDKTQQRKKYAVKFRKK
ncbi:uncharacterized protein [Haliotis cracherodii]|uniref:uncharacterized protein n=1 Tax=Haliotis cracherodii TaxID=6455 RepID=UPI0039EB53C7